jgi:hypothetical protein
MHCWTERRLGIPIALGDRRELGEIALDARSEVVILGSEHAQARLALPAGTLPSAFEAEALRQSWPFSRHKHGDRAGQ